MLHPFPFVKDTTHVTRLDRSQPSSSSYSYSVVKRTDKIAKELDASAAVGGGTEKRKPHPHPCVFRSSLRCSLFLRKLRRYV